AASNGVNFVPTMPNASFVQGNNASTLSPQTSVTVTYNSAQTAGNLNLIVVGWNDSTAQVQSVSDAAGNSYQLAAGPTVQPGVASQAMYYAPNIQSAPGKSNSVTVIFTSPAIAPDIRIAEYSGLDSVNPVDVAAAGMGNSASADSGSAATTNGNDLLVA